MALLRNLIESAFVAHLNGSSVGVPVYPGFAGTDKAAPCIVARAVSAEEEPLFSGNYRVVVNLNVKDSAGADTTSFDTLCEAVRDAIWNDELAASLNAAAPGLYIFAASSPHRIEWDIAEDCWAETHTVEIYAALTPN